LINSHKLIVICLPPQSHQCLVNKRVNFDYDKNSYDNPDVIALTQAKIYYQNAVNR